jgi:hypothetical protein
MPKTAVGLFQKAGEVDAAVREIEALGFPHYQVQTIGEPVDLTVTGLMSIPHAEFEAQVFRQLLRIGATKQQAERYLDGLKHHGVLLFATGPDEKVDAAAQVMNQHGAVDVEETAGPRPVVPRVHRDNLTPLRGMGSQAGRVRSDGGACFFVW